MMDSSYEPGELERRWYATWDEAGCFSPATSGTPYCIMLPPPNVTGRLHMGHAFQDTIMDALCRYRRMRGDAVLWQPGTDHAGIATQMVVERRLAAEGKSRHDLGREAFVAAVWDWKEESGGHIQDQMRRLGASVDWSEERFTMEPDLNRAVTEAFVRLWEDGLIYRGKRLVNWDPVLHTALSDLEVEASEEQGHLWHIRYPCRDGSGHLVVATTRPETLLGDTAVAVHPDDERYAELVGGELELPLTGRSIPVITDQHVDPEFGSGCVKITPAHDFDDYEVGKRHDLPVINVFNPDATLNDEVPEAYRGLDRVEARRRIVADLEEQGLLDRVEDHRLVIPRGDRSGAVLEPYLTDQWFVRIAPLAEPAVAAVREGRVRFVPENWSRTYFAWMERIEDWCISRQLWWGHRIPAWYDEEGRIHVGHDEADARRRSDLGDDVPLRQDEDVLDTWFSSALWPFSTLGWPDGGERLERFYPTSVLVTGFDIIFFWVARMVMMGLRFMDDVPFHDVYVTGLIRDAEGQKMSKSKGNVLDPIDLIDGIGADDLVEKRTSGLMQPQMAPKIERATRKEFPDGIPAYGCDAVRFTFAALATHGRDIRFDLDRVEGYRNFCNKLWNAARFVLLQETPGGDASGAGNWADRWIRSRLGRMLDRVSGHIDGYRFDLAAQALYDFIWNEYCDWYVELSKPVLRGDDADAAAVTHRTLLEVLEAALRALHPIMPFITEDIWQRLREPLGLEGEFVMQQPWPEAPAVDAEAEGHLDWLREVVHAVRRIRSELDLPPGSELPLHLQDGDDDDRARANEFTTWLQSLARVAAPRWLDADAADDEAAVALVGSLKILIPLSGQVDVEAELARLDRQLERERSGLERCQAKLDNRRFVDNAPAAVVEQERERVAAHEARLRELEAQRERIARLA